MPTPAPHKPKLDVLRLLALLALAALFPACGGGGGGGGGGDGVADGQGTQEPTLTPAPSGVPILYAVHSLSSFNGDETWQYLSRLVLDDSTVTPERVATNVSYSFARSNIRPWTVAGRLFVRRQEGVGLAPGDDVTYVERSVLDTSPISEVGIQQPVSWHNQALLGDTLYADRLGAFRRFPMFGSQSPTAGEDILAPGSPHAPRRNAGAGNGLLYDAEVTDSLITFYRRSPSTGALTAVGSFVRDAGAFSMLPSGTVAWENGCAVFARAALASQRLELWAFCDSFPNVVPAARTHESAPIPGLVDVLGVDMSRGFVSVHLRRQHAPGEAYDDGAVLVYDTNTGASMLVELDRATYDVEIQVLP